MMAMDQQQQQRMQMHPSMYGRMPHSGMMPSQPQGHPGMPGSMGVPSAAGGVPGGPGADPRQAMGMGGGGYHMSQHPSMMNNSQNNSYPGGVVPGGPPGGPVGPQGAQLPMPMTPHHQPYPHSQQQQQQQPTQQQTQQQQKQQHHNVPAASSSAPTHPSGKHIRFRSKYFWHNNIFLVKLQCAVLKSLI